MHKLRADYDSTIAEAEQLLAIIAAILGGQKPGPPPDGPRYTERLSIPEQDSSDSWPPRSHEWYQPFHETFDAWKYLPARWTPPPLHGSDDGARDMEANSFAFFVQPRVSFLTAAAQTVIRRVRLVHETAASVLRSIDQASIIVVGGAALIFADDLCPPQKYVPWPYPYPRPTWWDGLLDSSGLVILGSQFARAAQETISAALRKDFSDAAVRLAQGGLTKLNSE